MFKAVGSRPMDIWRHEPSNFLPDLAHSLPSIVMRRLTFAAGEVIYRSGDPPEIAYLVLDGEVETSRGPIVVSSGKGTIIGFSGLFQRPYGSTATARSDTSVLAFSRRELKALIYSNPDEAAKILDAMIELFGRVAAELERFADDAHPPPASE